MSLPIFFTKNRVGKERESRAGMGFACGLGFYLLAKVQSNRTSAVEKIQICRMLVKKKPQPAHAMSKKAVYKIKTQKISFFDAQH